MPRYCGRKEGRSPSPAPLPVGEEESDSADYSVGVRLPSSSGMQCLKYVRIHIPFLHFLYLFGLLLRAWILESDQYSKYRFLASHLEQAT